jgi:hypothetical protein
MTLNAEDPASWARGPACAPARSNQTAICDVDTQATNHVADAQHITTPCAMDLTFSEFAVQTLQLPNWLFDEQDGVDDGFVENCAMTSTAQAYEAKDSQEYSRASSDSACSSPERRRSVRPHNLATRIAYLTTVLCAAQEGKKIRAHARRNTNSSSKMVIGPLRPMIADSNGRHRRKRASEMTARELARVREANRIVARRQRIKHKTERETLSQRLALLESENGRLKNTRFALQQQLGELLEEYTKSSFQGNCASNAVRGSRTSCL